MASTAGRKSSVKYGTSSGGSFTAIAGVKSLQHSIDGTNVDDSEMGVDYAQRIQGLKDGKLTLTCARRAGDTGQDGIRDAMLNNTPIWIEVLPDNGTTSGAGFKQQMLCSKFAMDASVEDKVNLSIELEGTGTITTV